VSSNQTRKHGFIDTKKSKNYQTCLHTSELLQKFEKSLFKDLTAYNKEEEIRK
jgi:hypothetical protein